MVSQSKRRDSAASRRRLLAAAVHEFAARGFDGAKVDRIARRARVNKAMVYYHFRHKADLYRAVLLERFGAIADHVAVVRADGGTPDDQLRRFVATIADLIGGWPELPGIWLREMADGGRHVDAEVMAALRRVVDTLAAILNAGARDGRFAPAQPLVVQMGIVGPLLLFAASAPLRARLASVLSTRHADLAWPAVVDHIERGTLAVLTGPRPKAAAGPARRTRPRSAHA
jgi:TetR/AcrR family transcriptional regulator